VSPGTAAVAALNLLRIPSLCFIPTCNEISGKEKFIQDIREGVHWINLAQDRDNWRAVVSTVMNLVVP